MDVMILYGLNYLNRDHQAAIREINDRTAYHSHTCGTGNVEHLVQHTTLRKAYIHTKRAWNPAIQPVATICSLKTDSKVQ